MKTVKRHHDCTSSSEEEESHKKQKTSSRYRKRRHSTSSSCSGTSSTSQNSSTSSSSSSEEYSSRRHKKSKKSKIKYSIKPKKLKKSRKKKGKKSVKSDVAPKKAKKSSKIEIVAAGDGASTDIPLHLMDKSMAPMTKEQWEKQQSVIRRVYDEATGRYRLIKGDGEVLEEIVSRDRHKQINQTATRGDGDYFQSNLKHLTIRK